MLRIHTALILLLSGVGALPITAQRAARSSRDLQGTWSNGPSRRSSVPPNSHNRPSCLRGAAEYERTWLEKFRKNFTEEDLMAPDLDYTFMDRQKVVPSRRTSLITDPPEAGCHHCCRRRKRARTRGQSSRVTTRR